MTEHAEKVMAFLRQQGAVAIEVTHGGKHPRVNFTWCGKRRFYVIPSSSGDALRGYKAAISDLRHMLGLVGQKRIGLRRPRRHYKVGAPRAECPAITPLPDWQHQLLSSRSADELRCLADMAWLNLWRDCMAAVGGRSFL